MYTVLIIEDDHIMRKMLSRTLTPEYECIQTANASAGLKACAKEKPDLILLDVHLPDGNGLEVCREIKADASLRHIPIIILTGEASSIENRVEGLESGADDYILKPFSSKELMSRLKGILKTGTQPTRS